MFNSLGKNQEIFPLLAEELKNLENLKKISFNLFSNNLGIKDKKLEEIGVGAGMKELYRITNLCIDFHINDFKNKGGNFF